MEIEIEEMMGIKIMSWMKIEMEKKLENKIMNGM